MFPLKLWVPSSWHFPLPSQTMRVTAANGPANGSTVIVPAKVAPNAPLTFLSVQSSSELALACSPKNIHPIPRKVGSVSNIGAAPQAASATEWRSGPCRLYLASHEGSCGLRRYL